MLPHDQRVAGSAWTVRPLPPTLGMRGRIGVASVWALSAMCYSLRFHGRARIDVLGAACALGLIVAATLFASHRRARLLVDGDRLVHSTLFRDRVVRPDGAGGRVLELRIDQGRAASRLLDLWVLYDGDGKPAVCLNRRAWGADDLEAIRRAFGLRLESEETPIASRDALRRYPGVLPGWTARPVLAAVGVLSLILVLAALASL